MEESRYNSIAACLRFDAELEAFMEGEAKPYIASHAHDCPACGALLADLQAIRQVASTLPREEPSPLVWSRIRASLESVGAFGEPGCAQFDAELGPFMEGEARPFVVSHAHDCATCGALLADLQAIRQAASDLPLEEPSPRVWSKIRTSMESVGAFGLPGCAQFDAELEAFMEGEARPFVVSHAHDCAPCGAILADMQAIQAAAHDLPQVEPSPALWTNVRARLEAEGAFGLPACAQFDAELEAFMEGEARPFVASHAHDCATCGAVLEDLQSIQAAARDLPQEEPSRVVWANIHARLESEGAFSRPVSGWRHLLPWRVFVFPQPVPLGVLAALVVLGAAMTLPSSNIQRWENQAEVAETFSTTEIPPSAGARDDRALAHVVSDLESNFRANETSMTPDLKATYEKSLVSLDGSIKECLDSLQQEPGNTLAHDYLLTAYTRKAEVLSSALEFEGR